MPTTPEASFALPAYRNWGKVKFSRSTPKKQEKASAPQLSQRYPAGVTTVSVDGPPPVANWYQRFGLCWPLSVTIGCHANIPCANQVRHLWQPYLARRR